MSQCTAAAEAPRHLLQLQLVRLRGSVGLLCLAGGWLSPHSLPMHGVSGPLVVLAKAAVCLWQLPAMSACAHPA
jgi:hypothetical protein